MADFDRRDIQPRYVPRYDLSALQVTPNGIAGLDIYGDVNQAIKEIRDSIRAIPPLQEDAEAIKKTLVVVAGGLILLAAAAYFKL